MRATALIWGLPLLVGVGAVACGQGSRTGDSQRAPSSGAPSTAVTTATTVPDLQVRASDFKPLAAMTPVRGFFVDNLLGDLDATLAVARSPKGGTYPPGTVLQLVPGEAMVKHRPGYDRTTRDWEFFDLDVSKAGTRIHKRGAADVVNRFGGNCAACHSAAKPQFDFVCEHDHGCAPLPIGDDVIRAIQRSDPRPAH
jgi:hypothetical protein